MPLARRAVQREPERLLTLTDGIVAIATTLLVLPLVDLVPQVQARGLSWFASEHSSDLLAFALSFVVIYRFWAAHERAFGELEITTPAIRSLNMLWLLGIAFLPFPTALIGHRATTSSAFLYLSTLFVVSLLTSAIAQVAAASAAGSGRPRRAWVRMWIGTAVFGVCALISLVNPDAGLYGLLALVALRVLGPDTAGPDPDAGERA